MLFSAEYYDGKSALGYSGKISLEAEKITFIAARENSEKIDFQYDQIKEITEVEGKTKVLIKKTEESFTELLIIEGTSVANTLNVKFLAAQRGFKKLITVFKQYSKLKKILCILAFLPVPLIIIWLLIFKIYLIFPVSLDQKIGAKVKEELLANQKICDYPPLNDEVNQIKSVLIPENSSFDYNLKIVDAPLVNAFALPGGTILIYKGLINQSNSAEEIAGILAHEISHVERRHGLRQLIRIVGGAYFTTTLVGAGLEGVDTIENISEIVNLMLLLNYSRQFEREADLDALAKLKEKKISAAGLREFFIREFPDNLIEADNKKEFKPNVIIEFIINHISTHPSHKDRIKQFDQIIKNEKDTLKIKLKGTESWNELKQKCYQ